MRRIIWVIGLIVVVAALVGISTSRSSVSLERIADRVERAEVIPEETRAELRHLIETVAHDGHSKRNVIAAARIERAMQFKPVDRHAE